MLLRTHKEEDDIETELYIENLYYLDDNKPNSALILAINNFGRQGSELLEQLGCLGLTLDNEAVKKAEEKREALSESKVESNPFARALYDIGCFVLDELFDERPIARFWFLEVIARIPYFSYISILHLYESFGWWRGHELRKIHNTEEDNEFHHLLIMEALRGNTLCTDHFLGYYVAIAYYWALNALFFFSPKSACGFMALLEAHAVDTCGTFLKVNNQRLKLLPAPKSLLI